MKPLAVGLIVVLAALRPLGQEAPKKIPVEFSCDCDDQIGRLFATEFRDLLAKSPRFEQVDRVSDASPVAGPLTFRVLVVSLKDPKRDDVDAFSEVYLVGRFTYFNHAARLCSLDRAAECAHDTLAILDDSAQTLLKLRENANLAPH